MRKAKKRQKYATSPPDDKKTATKPPTDMGKRFKWMRNRLKRIKNRALREMHKNNKRSKAPPVPNNNSNGNKNNNITVPDTREVRERRIVKKHIAKAVEKMSSLMVEASTLIHFIVYEEMERFQRTKTATATFNELFGPRLTGIDFHPYFQMLFAPGVKPFKDQRPMPEKYEKLRQANNLQSHDVTGLSQIHCYAARQYAMTFKNNIKVHAWSRVRKFFRNTHPKIDGKTIYATMNYMFKPKTAENKRKYIPDATLLHSLKELLDHDGDFSRINTHWPSFVQFFYRLQRYNETNSKYTNTNTLSSITRVSI